MDPGSAETGAGNVKKLHGIVPPEYRLLVGDWRVRFSQDPTAMHILRVRNRREAYRCTALPGESNLPGIGAICDRR